MADFHQIWSQDVLQCPVAESRKMFSKNFTLGVICPQNLKSKVSQMGTSLRDSYRSQDALHSAQGYWLLHVVVQGPGSFQDLVNFSLRRTFAELRGVKGAPKLAQFLLRQMVTPI